MKKLLLFFLLPLSGFGQTIDLNFNTAVNGPYEEFIGIDAMCTDDGKLLTTDYYKIKRYNGDGSIDNTFTPIPDGSLDFFFKGSNGKFGGFNFSGDPQSINLYNQDGSAITGFTQPVLSDGGQIWNLLWQDDGKLMVVGDFTTINGIAYKRIARLNTDGSVDTTFNPGTGASAIIYCIARQPDGKYVIGGDFTTFNGVTKRHLVRLNANGTIDTTFFDYSSTSSGLPTGVRGVEIQSDGKIFVSASDFTNSGVFVSRSVSRLLANGARDTSFSCSITSLNTMKEFLILPNGKYLVYDSDDHILYRLNNNGTEDNTFNYNNTNISISWRSLFNLPGNKIFINSDYTSPTGVTRQYMHRINENGTIDLTFNPGQSTNKGCALNVLKSNKIIAVGGFTTYNDIPCSPRVCRLNENGAIDNSFTFDSQILFGGKMVIKEQADNKMLIAMVPDNNLLNSLSVNSVSKKLIRINENGSYDASFNLSTTGVSSVSDFEILNNGKILVVGNSTNGIKMVRYNSDGSADSSYTPITISDTYNTFTKFADGSIFRIGKNTNYDFVVRKLNADGTADTSFSCPLTKVFAINRQADGKYLVTYYSGGRKVSRVTNTGALDTTFTTISNSGADTGYNQLFINSEDKIFVFRITGFADSSTMNEARIYNSNGVFQQSVNGNFDFNMVQQGCDNLIMCPGNSQTTRVYDLRRYKIFTGTITPSPTGTSPQPFMANYTLANLIVSGANIQWYATQSQCGNNFMEKTALADTPLPLSTPLVNGTTYYASQTVGGIESTYRLPVLVTSTLGLSDSAFETFSINNPVRDNLQLHCNSTFSKVELYSINGVKLLEELFQNSNDAEVNVSGFTKGFYIVKLYTEEGVFSKKVIKE